MIKAVIFDMDGLLIDSNLLWVEAENKVLGKLGVPVLDNEKMVHTFGLREEEAVEYWFSKYPWQGSSKEEVLSGVIQEVVHLFKTQGKLMEGANEVIELFSLQNIPIAVASSSEMIIIETALTKFSIKDKMKVICSAENVTKGKPEPEIYLTTAKKLEVTPSECLVFEDSINGVLAAKAAKMKCVAVPDVRLKRNKSFNIADLTLNSLKDFTLEHLKKLDI